MSADKFVWYELMTSDLAGATAFYGAVIGWTLAQHPHSDPPYFIASADKVGVAGMMTLPDRVRENGGRPGWLGYVGVDDIAGACDRVAKAGGSVHRPPADIPEVGQFALVTDPFGAFFYLFKPFSAPDRPDAAPDAPGHVGWRELYSDDGPKAFEFYASQFGWTKEDAMDMGAMGVYQIFAANGVAIGGMMTRPPSVPRSLWAFYFNVPELGAAMARVSANGGKILMGPQQVPGGSWIAQCLDPQGAQFAMVSRTP